MWINKLKLNPGSWSAGQMIQIWGYCIVECNSILKNPVPRLGVLLKPSIAGPRHICLACAGVPAVPISKERSSTKCSMASLLAQYLDYCNTFFMGQPLKMVWKVQLLQNTAGRVIIYGLIISGSLLSIYLLPGLQAKFQVADCYLTNQTWLKNWILERLPFPTWIWTLLITQDFVPSYTS